MNEQIAWLAGLWDGEGSVGITIAQGRGRVYLTAALQLSMTCKTTVTTARDLLVKVGVTAASYSYRRKDPKKHLDAHCLHVARLGDIVKVARLLLPHAVTKRKQWQAMLEYVESRLSKVSLDEQGRVRRGGNKWGMERPFTAREVELARVLRALNARGPAAKRREAAWLRKLEKVPRATAS